MNKDGLYCPIGCPYLICGVCQKYGSLKKAFAHGRCKYIKPDCCTVVFIEQTIKEGSV